MASPDDFAKRIFVIASNIDRNGPQIVRKVGLAIHQAVVLATPVDTGRARANWVVQLGSPYRQTIAPFVPGEKGSTGGANAQAAINQGQAALADVKSGDQIFISNNLPYITRLNQGWSAQAPAAFVEQAVNAGVQAVRGASIMGTPDGS